MPVVDLAALKKARKKRKAFIDVPLPENGDDSFVRLRAPVGDDYLRLSDNGKRHPSEDIGLLLVLCIVDETGKQIFGFDDIPDVTNYFAPVSVGKIFEAALTLVGGVKPTKKPNKKKRR